MHKLAVLKRALFEKLRCSFFNCACFCGFQFFLDRCQFSGGLCQNGGYPHPRHCDRCICPNGIGGTFCEKNEAPLSKKGENCKYSTCVLLSLLNFSFNGVCSCCKAQICIPHRIQSPNMAQIIFRLQIYSPGL